MSGTLLTTDLFDQILLSPAQNGATEIFIVSGYASSAMVFHHAQKLIGHNVKINLIIGMTPRDGLSRTNHRGFQSLMENDLDGIFSCSYLINRSPVHSKVYSWVQNNEPVIAYTGSANYSQQAFMTVQQGEATTQCNPEQAYEYYQSLINDSIYCTHQDAEFVIDLYRDYRPINTTEDQIIEPGYDDMSSVQGLEQQIISFINRDGEISQRSALNWGHRLTRARNEAYIPVKAAIDRSNFFPAIAQHFTVCTDDGKILICTRAQENGKAITTPHNNSLLGEYFRFRLNLPSGELITMEHLEGYGRTDVTFYKIDEENYFMDFSV